MRQGGLILAAGRVSSRRKKNKNKNTNKSAPPKTHHEIHSSPATAINSRRRATKHVPRARSYSLASIDPSFVQIGFVQLSQSVKTTNVTHTHRQTHRHADRLMKYSIQRLFISLVILSYRGRLLFSFSMKCALQRCRHKRRS